MTRSSSNDEQVPCRLVRQAPEIGVERRAFPPQSPVPATPAFEQRLRRGMPSLRLATADKQGRGGRRHNANCRMTRRMAAAAGLALLWTTSGGARADVAGAGDLENTLVRVTVAFQQPDAGLPWRKQSPGIRHGYAVLLDETRAVTTESLVRNHTMAEVQQARRGERIPARVLMADPQANLALLELPAGAADWQPAPLARKLEADDRFHVFQFDENGQIQRGAAQTVRIAMTSLPNMAFPALTFTVLTELNINGEGAAAMAGDSLAGLMISYDKDTRTGAMIPYNALERFFADATEPPYKGLATAGFSWAPLVDPVRRAFLHVQNQTGGIQVLACLPGAGAMEALRPHDVILSMDGFPIDNMGFYEDPDFGRLLFPHLITGRRKPGDTIRLELVRDREPMDIELSLARYRDEYALIPENTEGHPAEYLVEGGLILRELSGDYLQAFGRNWARRVDARLTDMYFSRRFLPDQPGDRVVILSGVLPDAINIGYTRFSNAIVQAVNATPVSNLRDVFDVFDRDGAIYRVRLKSLETDLVLDRAALPAANTRIAAQYRIPNLQFRNREPFETESENRP